MGISIPITLLRNAIATVLSTKLGHDISFEIADMGKCAKPDSHDCQKIANLTKAVKERRVEMPHEISWPTSINAVFSAKIDIDGNLGYWQVTGRDTYVTRLTADEWVTIHDAILQAVRTKSRDQPYPSPMN